MPDIVFAPGVTTSPAAWINLFNNLGNVPGTTATPTQMVFTQGAAQPTFVINGSGFTYDISGTITGGTIDNIEFRNFGVVQVTFTSLALSAQGLQEAAVKDALGLVDTAVEDLLLPLGWKFTGANNADVMPSTAVSSDGVPLNFKGNDTFILNGGNDNVWLGDGNDSGSGGSGRDTIDGGAGKDKLSGGSGNDSLKGGLGNDTFNGGTGSDQMSGDGGRDVFVFNVGDGGDRIYGFDLALDSIDLAPGVPHNIMNNGGFCFVTYGPGGDGILLDGVLFGNAGLVTFI